MSSRLVIDARWLHTGIGRYVMNVLEGLKHRNGFTVRALARKRDAGLLRPLCDDVTIVDLPIYGWREQLRVPWAARGAGLLHVPHYNVPVMFRGDFLVTIHDLIHLMDFPFSQSLLSRAYAWPLLRFATRQARAIVTVSNYSKGQIVEQLGVPEKKISVIYNGVHPRFRLQNREEARAQVKAAFSFDAPYFLYVGNLKPHKNVDLLLRGFGLLRERKKGGTHLVILGEGEKQRKSLQALCARLGISDQVHIIPRVSEEFLPSLYGAAELFIMPSLAEGFGYPVVEAMACGTPVVCSRTSALPEIAGDAAQFFDPTSCEDMVAAVEKVMQSRDHREVLRERGLKRARIFAWEECGRNHAELYKKTLSA
ncbi:MAG TPA: glycosyltransferase family 1 protein [Terriglobia bacterium]|nr:glycosyltransferase family 1 protein [Terriglobia bacterium]